MNDKNGFTISNRDHVLRAWQNSTELVRDYQDYAHETENEDKKLSELFADLPRRKPCMPQSCLNGFKSMKKSRELE